MNYGILLQGFGGIFVVPLVEAYGRWDLATLCKLLKLSMTFVSDSLFGYGLR